MNIATFRKMTLDVIQEEGIPEYIPTLILPSEKVVIVLEEIPGDVSHEAAARKWVKDSGHESKEYFLAFKMSDEEIRLEHHKDNSVVETAIIK